MAIDSRNDLDQSALVDRLVESAQQLDRPQVAELAAALADEVRQSGAALPFDDTKRVLKVLRRKRFFAQMQCVADALIQAGDDAPFVRQQYAQALIDQGALAAATSVLRALIADTSDAPAENFEARGLLGRALKQQYVITRAPSTPRARTALFEAIGLYANAYHEDPPGNHWHGINVVACVARARRDGLEVSAELDEREIAATILARIEPRIAATKGAPDAWELASAVEACVALGDAGKARLLAREYVAHKEADAFELASTVRQLTEVWQLDATGGIGGVVLPILRAALLHRERGHVEMRSAEVHAKLERSFIQDGFQSLAWFADGLARARLVARLGTKYQSGVGTGFLVPGKELSEQLRGRWVLLTNAHVVSNVDDHGAPMQPGDAIATFEASAPAGVAAKSHRVRPQALWVSGPEQLDTAVLELEAQPEGLSEADDYTAAARLPANPDKDRIYIIGHPAGRSLSYSLQDNLFLGHNESKLHYRTPTEPGSSGSPLFDAEWRLIGIHHAGADAMTRLDGKGTYQANEGISIHAIRKGIASDGLTMPA